MEYTIVKGASQQLVEIHHETLFGAVEYNKRVAFDLV